jgi:peptidylprolyl isomerase
MKVQMGHTVSVHYVGTLQDGTEFDNSRLRDRPLEFQMGVTDMIPGFVDAIVGMSTGETRSVTLQPSDAYGHRDPDARQAVPRAAFGPDFEFEVGGTVQGNGPQGKFLATIEDYDDDEVVLDLNHPLSGEHLTFEIELVSIESETQETEEEIVMSDWNAKMRKAELLQVAKSRGLPVNTRSTKAQIIEALQAQ